MHEYATDTFYVLFCALLRTKCCLKILPMSLSNVQLDLGMLQKLDVITVSFIIRCKSYFTNNKSFCAVFMC